MGLPCWEDYLFDRDQLDLPGLEAVIDPLEPLEPLVLTRHLDRM